MENFHWNDERYEMFPELALWLTVYLKNSPVATSGAECMVDYVNSTRQGEIHTKFSSAWTVCMQAKTKYLCQQSLWERLNLSRKRKSQRLRLIEIKSSSGRLTMNCLLSDITQTLFLATKEIKCELELCFRFDFLPATVSIQLSRAVNFSDLNSPKAYHCSQAMKLYCQQG